MIRKRGSNAERGPRNAELFPVPRSALRVSLFGSVGLLAVALCASAGPGYLPVVGPPTLRFAPPSPPPPAVLIPLPPLAVVDPRPTPPAADPLAPVVDSSIAAADPVLIDPFAVPPAAEPIPSPATYVTPAVPVGTDNLVPQMFMKYFVGGAGTNGAGVSIFSPVNFVPPLPIVPPSSSATFQTVPPAKP